MSRHYKKQHKKQRVASSSDWQHLTEDSQLREAYTTLVQTIHLAQASAEERSKATGLSLEQTLDLRAAGRILDQYPQLVKYIEGIREREEAHKDAMTRDLSTKSNPTGSSRGDTAYGGLGGWTSGSGFNRNQPIAVHNAKQLREWASDEWVDAALNFLSEKVSRADLQVLPLDERKSYNRVVLKDMQQLFDYPNELGDTWPMLLGMFTRDVLTLGQGVFTKNMQMKPRVPVGFYTEDAANIKIYPAWSGDPSEPRYLYQEGNSYLGKKVPLRNDEAMVVFYNPTSFRYGQGPVQVLANTIQSDMAASEAAYHFQQFKPPPNAIQLQGYTQQQINALRSLYEQEVMGRRQILFLGGNAPAHVFPLVFSARDNQWLEWQEYLLRKICACFQVSPQDIGATFQINRATAEVQQDISETKGFIPLLLLIEEHLNREFLANFAPLRNGKPYMDGINLRAVFPEVSEAARMIHAERMVDLATKSLAGLPSMTLNQVLMARGEEPVKGGNTFYMASANGPIPWLSYDDELGAYTSPLGMQDPAGGVDDTEDVGADDTSDSDMGKSDDTSSPESSTSETAGANVESASSDVGGAEGTQKSYRASYIDMRKPGRAWSPSISFSVQKAATSRGRVPPHIAATYQRPAAEEQARREVKAAVQRIFEEATRSGKGQKSTLVSTVKYNPNHDSHGRFGEGEGGGEGEASGASASGDLPLDPKAFHSALLSRFGDESSSTYKTYKTTIDGQEYFAKEIPQGDPSLARELLGRQLAVDGGLADRSLAASAIEREGKTYLVQPWVSNGKPLCDVSDEKVTGLLNSMSSEDLTRMQLHEYVLNDFDRHSGNYMVDKTAGKLMEMDFGNAGRNLADDHYDVQYEMGHAHAAALDTGSVLTSHLLSEDARLSSSTIKSYSKQLDTMYQHIEASGAYGKEGLQLFRQRMQAIRQLSRKKSPTIQDLQLIAEGANQFKV